MAGDGDLKRASKTKKAAIQTVAFTGAGTEPLTIGAEEFAALFRGRKLAIKAALLNQSLLTGVGNIYADESLFRAGIRPRRRAGRLTRVELERLRAALKSVLEHAIRLGGSSVSDYVDADGVRRAVKETGMGWVPPASAWARPGPWQFSQPIRSFSVRGCFRKSRPILVWLNRLKAGSWQALHTSAPM